MKSLASTWRRLLARPKVGCCNRVAVCLLLALAAFHFPPSIANAETPLAPRFTHITVEDGLSHNLVFAVMQDRRGFMWFGTQDGLNRYDGYTLTAYRHRRSAPDSLADNPIYALLEDSTGTIWVGTPRGLDSFAGDADHFTHYPAISEQVSSLHEDRSGVLWIGTSGSGLYRFDRENGEFRQYRHDPGNASSLSSDQITAIHEDGQGTLWVGTAGGGLNALDLTTGVATHYVHSREDPGSLSYDWVTAIGEDRDGTLWVGTGSDAEPGSGGLNALDRSSGRFTRYLSDPNDPHTLSHNRVTFIRESRAGVLWVGTADGLTVRDPEDGSFRRYRHDPSDPSTLNGTRIWAMAEDHSGVLWFGSDDGGVSKYAPAKERFVRYRPEPQEPNSLHSARVGAVLEDREGSLWIGFLGGGLDRLDTKSGRFTHFNHNPADPTSLGHDTVKALYEDRGSNLWVGTNGGLDRLDRATGSFSHYTHDPADPASLGPGLVRAITEDADGALWVGFQAPGSLSRLDPRTGRFTHFQHDHADPRSFIDTFGVTALHQDRAGDLWVATYSGLLRLTSDGGFIAHYRHSPEDPSGLSHDFTWSIQEDEQGGLWLGTDGGLNYLDPTSGGFTVYGREDGLAADQVKAVLADEDGHLWLGTDGGGISRFDPKAMAVRNYDLSDGIAGKDVVVGAYHRGPSGRMYLGTYTGLTAFHPSQVNDNPHVAPVALTAFRRFDQPMEFDRPLAEVATVELTHEDNFFALEFAALDYTDPAKNRYAYRLDGFDRDWVQSGSRRYASYTGVPPGEYTFQVKGSNNDGVWNETGLSIRIVIVPPFWQKWWFRLLGITLLLGAAGLALGLRERYVATLRASEERFRALFENAPLGVAELDVAPRPPRIRRANQRAEQIYGYPAARLQGAGLDGLFPAHAWAHVAEALPTAAPGQTLTVESRGLRQDGSQFPIRLSATRRSAPDDRLMILVVEDITAEKERRSEEEAIDEERRRIAREIHDGLAQDMAGLRYKVGQWRHLVDHEPTRMHAELDSFQKLLTRNLREIRRSIFALRPLALADLGFYPALRQFLLEFGEQNQLRVELRVVGAEDRLPAHLEPVLFRIIQEAINNIGKHAQATAASVTLDLSSATQVRLGVHDDGVGFDPAQKGPGTDGGHLGLLQMQERVERLRGSLQVTSQPGAGTRIDVSLPFEGG